MPPVQDPVVLPATDLIARESGNDRTAMAEIDRQIATARKFPRLVKEFMDEALSLATLNDDVAASCFYTVPRAGKNVIGPSVRLAEILVSCWGHARSEARIVNEDERFITARGTTIDLQRNTAIAFEVRRRITDRNGQRYNDDMIANAANAAAAIALRNSILRVIPKAFWEPIYEQARKVAIGKASNLADRRARLFEKLNGLGVPSQRIFDSLKVKGIEDITIEHMEPLIGIGTAIKEGDITIDEAFPLPEAEQTAEEQTTRKDALSDMKARLTEKQAKEKKPEGVDKKTGEEKPLVGIGTDAKPIDKPAPPKQPSLTDEENRKIDAEIAAEEAKGKK